MPAPAYGAMPFCSDVRCALFWAIEGVAVWEEGGSSEAGGGIALTSLSTAGGVAGAGSGCERFGASLRQTWPASSRVGSPLLEAWAVLEDEMGSGMASGRLGPGPSC